MSQDSISFAFFLERISSPLIFSLSSTYTLTKSPNFKSLLSLNSEIETIPSDLEPTFKTTSLLVIPTTLASITCFSTILFKLSVYNFSKSFLSLSEYSEEKSFTESHENSSNFSSLGFDIFLATGFLTSSFFEEF